MFDSVSDERRPSTGIVIRNGRIDLHAHYNLDLVDNGRVEEVIYNGIVFLANGVTSAWSAGEYYPERVIAQRDRIDAGESVGPRLFASGPVGICCWKAGLLPVTFMKAFRPATVFPESPPEIK